MLNLRVLPTFLILASVHGLFCVALKLPEQVVLALDPEEKSCSGESCPEDESSNIDFMSDFLDLDPLLLKKNEINEGEIMPVEEFLEVTDHEPVSREKNGKEVGSADGSYGEKVEIVTDGTKDIILNKLLKNAGQQKPNKLQGPSLIARYVQGVRGAVASRSRNGDGKIEEKKKVDDTTKVKEAKEEMHDHEHINFMSDFLDMDPLSMKTNEGADLFEDSFENVTHDQGSMVNLTENQGTHLDFMADFLDEDHMDVQLNQSEDSDNVTDTPHLGMQTNVTDISDYDTLSIDNVTESSVNDTVDLTKDQDEKQIDFLANLLEEDLVENVSESESIESKSDSAEMKCKNEETDKQTGDDNELDFVTDFLSSDPFDTEAIDRSDAVEINAVQEENLDFLTDFLSEDSASVQSHPDEEIPQDILELYSEDEVVPEQEEVYKRKKPISSNVEWAKEEAKKEPSSVWNWFGF